MSTHSVFRKGLWYHYRLVGIILSLFVLTISTHVVTPTQVKAASDNNPVLPGYDSSIFRLQQTVT